VSIVAAGAVRGAVTISSELVPHGGDFSWPKYSVFGVCVT
jgi:hypothetical protein